MTLTPPPLRGAEYLSFAEERDARIAAEEAASRRERDIASIPLRFRAAEPDDTEVGTGLYLVGTIGTGKTHRAAGIMIAHIDRGERANFIHVGTWLDARREGHGGGPRPLSIADLTGGATAGALLVLDDIGLERPNEYAIETLDVLVNEAYNQCTKLVVTSNLTYSQLSKRIGARVVSRLAEMCRPVEMTGLDRRVKYRSTL